MSLNLHLYLDNGNDESNYLDVLFQTPTQLTLNVLNEPNFQSQLEIYFEWVQNLFTEDISVPHIDKIKKLCEKHRGRIHFSGY